jgi:hypothetical protein
MRDAATNVSLLGHADFLQSRRKRLAPYCHHVNLTQLGHDLLKCVPLHRHQCLRADPNSYVRIRFVRAGQSSSPPMVGLAIETGFMNSAWYRSRSHLLHLTLEGGAMMHVFAPSGAVMEGLRRQALAPGPGQACSPLLCRPAGPHHHEDSAQNKWL